MRVLCCLDGTNAEQIGKALHELAGAQSWTVGLLYVIDNGPRKEMDHIRERFFRPPAPPPEAEREMTEAEETTARAVLDEGLRYCGPAETLQRQGRPEREIVNLAAEWLADLVMVCSRAQYGEPLKVGPKSVGHVARFVLDHAPCPVLLVRPLAQDQFPLSHHPPHPPPHPPHRP